VTTENHSQVVPADWREHTTVTVPAGGVILAGLCRNSAYAAAARGDLPTVQAGGRKVVPVAKLRRLLAELPEFVDEGHISDAVTA
jgi:hypothetical protein